MSGKKAKAVRRALRKEIRKADIKAKKPRYIPKFLWHVFVKRAQLIFGKVGIRDKPNPGQVIPPSKLGDYEIGPIQAFVYTDRKRWQFWKPKKVYGNVGQYTKMGRQVNVMINGGFYLTGKDVTIRGISTKGRDKEDENQSRN